jgi:hypothetical protein
MVQWESDAPNTNFFCASTPTALSRECPQTLSAGARLIFQIVRLELNREGKISERWPPQPPYEL